MIVGRGSRGEARGVVIIDFIGVFMGVGFWVFDFLRDVRKFDFDGKFFNFYKIYGLRF